MEQPTATDDDDMRYRALQARDARFDGSFLVGVTSTGIYCRPVCKVKLPRRENCLFFGHAALAEKAGFRPCLRCRPELAPHALHWSVQDGSALLARQALRLLDEPTAFDGEVPSAERLAARLGVSDRHLRRLFEAQFGVSPLQYVQTRRLLTAKQLLADTDLPVTEVAHASGFASVRRFNAVFLTHYGLNPSQLRRAGPVRGSEANTAAQGITVRLGYRPPYDVAAMRSFLAKRALASVEAFLEDGGICRSVALEQGGKTHSGWVQARFDEERCQLLLTVAPALRGVLPLVLHRVRAWLDLDADPQAIDAVLGRDFPGLAGLRVPGCMDGYELAVRAVLGQQITVAAARTLAQRLLDRFGTPLDSPWSGVNRLFPTPAVLAQASGDALGSLGIVRQRQAAIHALAQAVAFEGLSLNGGADVPATIAALKQLPGIGEWTAQYIAMRALRWPDAFPAGDVALHKSLGLREEKNPTRATEQAAQAWKPWRSYAVLRAWQRL